MFTVLIHTNYFRDDICKTVLHYTCNLQKQGVFLDSAAVKPVCLTFLLDLELPTVLSGFAHTEESLEKLWCFFRSLDHGMGDLQNGAVSARGVRERLH